MKNSADLGGCNSLRARAEVNDFLGDLLNSSYIVRKPNSIIALLFIQNISPFFISLFVFLLTKSNSNSCPGFLSERVNDLQWAVLLTSFWSHWLNITVFLSNLVNSSWLW